MDRKDVFVSTKFEKIYWPQSLSSQVGPTSEILFLFLGFQIQVGFLKLKNENIQNTHVLEFQSQIWGSYARTVILDLPNSQN